MATMKDCTVSVTSPQDGRTHTVEVTASSLFDAAAQAMRSWSMLWWYASDLVIEVRCGDLRWRVRADRVQAWQAGRRIRRS
jgi:hypothetical protein